MKATNYKLCGTFFTSSLLHTQNLSLSLSLAQVQIIYFYAIFNKSLNTIISLKGYSKLQTFILIAHQLRVWCVYFHLKILRHRCEGEML